MSSSIILAFCMCITHIAIAVATDDLAVTLEEYPGSKQTTMVKPLTNCQQSTYHFPNGDQTRSYLRIKTPVPDLKQFTSCLWMKRYSNNYDPWISYSNGRSNNAMIVETRGDALDLLINSQRISIPFPFPTSTDYHVCIASASSTTGKHYVFVNGELHQLINHAPGIVKGGGVFIIGQEQDAIGGGFSATQSLQGRVSNLAIWDRLLDLSEIVQMYQNRCICPPASILSSEINNVDINGGVSTQMTREC